MWSQLCVFILCTMFGLYIIRLKATVTLTFNRLISKSIGSSTLQYKFEEPWSILCLVIIQTRFGLYVNMLMITLTLTFDRMTSKSIGFIYTLRSMSVTNLTNLGQFCVYLSSGQGKVYRPTDICKAIHPHFIEGEHDYMSY